MKKIFVLLSLLSPCMAIASDGCALSSLKMPDEQMLLGAGRYLYPTVKSKSAKNAFLCGDGTCKQGDMVYLTETHYLGQNVKNGNVLYFCDAKSFVWTPKNFSELPRCNLSLKNRIYVTESDGGYAYASAGSNDKVIAGDAAYVSDEFCYSKQKLEELVCAEFDGTELYVGGAAHSRYLTLEECTTNKFSIMDPRGKVFKVICSQGPKLICEPVECDVGYIVKNRKCVQQKKEVVTDISGCLNSRESAEGRACCYVATSVAKWENGKCNCVDSSKTFDVELRQCVSLNGAQSGNFVDSVQCLDILVGIQDMVINGCETMQSDVDSLKTQCVSGKMTVENLKSHVLDIQTRCLELKSNNQIKQKLLEAGVKLDNMFADFEINKWKDDKGQFNTARLASDSIAGVVLGTTGGLITSKVMKKKQVEQGFEDIQCIIGNQSIAGWGDEFVVGVQ